jgi:uncharacterized membrane protein
MIPLISNVLEEILLLWYHIMIKIFLQYFWQGRCVFRSSDHFYEIDSYPPLRNVLQPARKAHGETLLENLIQINLFQTISEQRLLEEILLLWYHTMIKIFLQYFWQGRCVLRSSTQIKKDFDMPLRNVLQPARKAHGETLLENLTTKISRCRNSST